MGCGRRFMLTLRTKPISVIFSFLTHRWHGMYNRGKCEFPQILSLVRHYDLWPVLMISQAGQSAQCKCNIVTNSLPQQHTHTHTHQHSHFHSDNDNIQYWDDFTRGMRVCGTFHQWEYILNRLHRHTHAHTLTLTLTLTHTHKAQACCIKAVFSHWHT